MANIELEMDPVIHDLSLAKEYLNKENYSFQCIPLQIHMQNKTVLKNDIVSNEVFVVPKYKTASQISPTMLNATFNGNREALLKKLQDNAKLFAQLELMIRNISEEESLANLKLIQQCLRTGIDILSTNTRCSQLFFCGQSPLSDLGLSINFIHKGKPFVITSTQNTAAVTTLFVKLCREAGIKINLVFVPEEDTELSYDKFSELSYEFYNRQCTGVVTETADIDTAVETFVSSFSKKPWSINRVLVQENVYDSFKKSLEWKCRNSKSQQELPDNIKDFSSVVHQVDNQIFLLDYLGDITLVEKDGIVLVEAFRTDSELISLLKVQKPFCITLWCNDITIANKIAYSTNASYTWINDYISFEGPGEVSQAYYSGQQNHLSEITHRACMSSDELNQKLPIIARKIRNWKNAFEILGSKLKDTYYEGFKKISIEEQGLSIVTGEISDVIYIEFSENYDVEDMFKRISTAAQFKKSIVIDHTENEIIDILNESTLPVMKTNSTFNNILALYKTKCVWTKFPTI